MWVIGSEVRRQAGSRHGAAAVELALILPVLVTLVLGCIDVGRFAYAYVAVSNGARAGAGFASVRPWTTNTLDTWNAEVRRTVAEEMSNLDTSQLAVSSMAVTEADGRQRVQVTASYPFQTVVSWPGLPNQVTLRRTVVFPTVR